MRGCAYDPVALGLVAAQPSWDEPHRLLAAVRWLVLAGEIDDYRDAPDKWAAFHAVLVERGEWVAQFVREQLVQTNEVQRCFALLPLFLTVARAAGRPLDLLELGPSAGLNLVWDRYRYSYREGTWGPRDASLELEGEERAPVPAALLGTAVEVRRRRGIDKNPVDVTRSEGVRMLEAFASDEPERLRKLHAAIDVVRREPPELVHGDYLELLPALLEDRDDGALTVVFQTLSTIYLPVEQREHVRACIDTAAAAAPLAWISTPTPEEHGQRRGDYPLELAIWPGSERRIVARTNNRGEWLEWVG
jgi:hypothetical protein